MKVLVLSLDRALIKQNKEGDTLHRLQEYRKFCQYLGVIVPIVGKKLLPKIIKKIEIIPACGSNSFLAYWQACQNIKKICQDKSIDLIVTNDAVLGALAIWFKRKPQTKVQVNIFGLEILSSYWIKERPQNIFLKWTQEWAIRKADGLRVDNTRTKKLLIAHYRIDPENIVVVTVAPSQESQERFLKAKRNKKLKEKMIGKNKKMILSIGSLDKAKDLNT